MSSEAAASILARENGGRPPVQVWGTRGMVVAMHPIAAQTALDVLRDGGNAFDAAVALSAAIAVVSPDWAGLAGDAAWLLYDATSNAFLHLDGYSTCPRAMTPERLVSHFALDPGRVPRAMREEPQGLRAIGIATSMVPGTPASWDALARRLCTISLPDLLAPAIHLATTGFVVNRYLAESFRISDAKLRAHATSIGVFADASGGLPVEGTVLVQPALGDTLAALADRGIDAFYRGTIADRVAQHASAHGGSLAPDDFADHRAVWRSVSRHPYRGIDVVVTGAPTAGVHLLQALAILERFDLRSSGYHSARSLHLLIESTKRALAERRTFGGDPDAGGEDARALLSVSRIDALCASIRDDDAAVLNDVDSPGASTTHFLVRDSAGNVVSATQSLGSRFGCGETVPDTGLLMNDRSWWMSLDEGPNVVAPGRRANIGHAPAILCDAGRPVAALGSPGGFGILQYMAQTIVNMLDYELDVQDAIEAPRFRLEGLGRRVWIERRIAPEALAALQALGHDVVGYPPWTDRMGGVEGLQIDVRTDATLGGYDPRRNSMAHGLN